MSDFSSDISWYIKVIDVHVFVLNRMVVDSEHQRRELSKVYSKQFYFMFSPDIDSQFLSL